jgi:hypothetical protein
MKFVVAFVLLAGVGCAQVGGNADSAAGKPGTSQPPAGTVLLCRLESVTWNPETEELSWVVSMRDVTSGLDQPEKRASYMIHVDTGVMSSNGEGRKFDPDEAHQVGQLMEMVNAYAVESTVWWAKGLGQKVNPKEKPPSQQPDKPKGDQTKPSDAPPLRGPQALMPNPRATVTPLAVGAFPPRN